MDYPSEFSTEAKNRIEAEKITAYRDFEEAKRTARWSSDVEPLLRKCVLRIFLAFAREACALGRRDVGAWSIDKIEREGLEFLRRTTIRIYYDKGFRSVTSRVSGLIDASTDRAFMSSVEWQEYQDLLLEVANYHVSVPAGTRTKPGPKRAVQTARQVAGIVAGLSPSDWRDKLDDICEALDEQKVPQPRTWRKNGIPSWSDAAADCPNLAKKAIQHHLKNASRP